MEGIKSSEKNCSENEKKTFLRKKKRFRSQKSEKNKNKPTNKHALFSQNTHVFDINCIKL